MDARYPRKFRLEALGDPPYLEPAEAGRGGEGMSEPERAPRPTFRRRLVPALCLALMPLVTGCVGSPFSDCGRVDDELADAVMSTARTDFSPSDNPEDIVTHLDFLRARSYELPEDLHEFGMSELVALNVVVWFDATADNPIDGVHLPMGFAVSEDHTRFVPVGELSRKSFDSDDPALTEPGYDDWVKEVGDSKALSSALACARD